MYQQTDLYVHCTDTAKKCSHTIFNDLFSACI